MKRVIFKFTDGSHINLAADSIKVSDDMIFAWKGDEFVAMARIDVIDVCYFSEKKEQEE